jgi:hypothetical protein
MEDTNENTPKWMKFFEHGNPLFIDIERSLKIENIDLLFTFVKVHNIYLISNTNNIFNKDESSSIYFRSTFHCLFKILKRQLEKNYYRRNQI